ncbi:RNA pseudouridine synthase 7 isoform X1 [Iris pallida]|nr:RNA pseudouridine synthase 7 isoform X1 [Iris pallida]
MEIVWETPANQPEANNYVFHNGQNRRRYVKPYFFEFISHAKNRWAGKTIVDLFAEEFRGRPYEYYVDAVKSGRIQVDGHIIHTSYIVQSSQKISHFLHRHEPPVLSGNVMIIQSEPDVVTVCKPASVPVHPCGQYRKNTVVGILQAEHNLSPIFPIHRLDRLVSGLLIFARNAGKAECFRQQIEAGLVQKEYVAKVLGSFPEGEQVVNANVNYDAREGRSSVEVDEECTGKPLKGKTACTKFLRISTNGTHSVVLCKPVTGRTHQIRVHLQYTGHPIANDVLYLSKLVASRSTVQTGADRAASIGMNQSPPCDSPVGVQCANPAASGDSPPCDPAAGDRCSDVYKKQSDEEFSIDPMCTNCPNWAPRGYDGDEEGLWLHCVRYSGPDWSYECPLPEWAFLN